MKPQESRKNILKELYKVKQKELDKTIAHSLKAYVSSLRLLLGGFNAGEIDEGLFISVLDAIKGKCHSDIDINNYIKESKSFREKTPKPKDKLSSIISRGSDKILLIDDEYNTIGWDLVFNAIFGKGRVLFAADKDTAWELLRNNKDIALVLLDLRFPNDPSEGINLLNEIKEKRLDLPVVIFTGEDTIKYQRKCFAGGAFDYFVKEFKEEDKNYIDYYETFKDIIENALRLSGLGKNIWQDIIKLEQDIKEAGPPFFNDIIHYLKKGYYFLTINEENWFTKMILSENNITHYGEVVIQSALATEGILYTLFRDNKNDPKIQSILSKVSNDLEKVTYGEKLKGLRMLRILDEKCEKICESINILRRKCVHPKKAGLEINGKQASSTLKEAIGVLRSIIFSPNVLKVSVASPNVLKGAKM